MVLMDGDVGLLLTFLVTLRRDFLDPSIHLLEYELRSCLLDLGGGPVDAFGGEGGGGGGGAPVGIDHEEGIVLYVGQLHLSRFYIFPLDSVNDSAVNCERYER